MNYKSNLPQPDFGDAFRLRDPPLQTMGHDMPSDPVHEPDCGYLTHDEGAILAACVRAAPGGWVDVGSRFGWSTAHILAGGAKKIYACDPIYRDERMLALATRQLFGAMTHAQVVGALELFDDPSPGCFKVIGAQVHANPIVGVHIDGNHDSPAPVVDAGAAATHLPLLGVIVFHDFQGAPIREAVTMLLQLGWSARVYWTPNGMAVCWRGDYKPPNHFEDDRVDWREIEKRYSDFNFERCK